MKKTTEIENIEIDLLLDGIYKRYGYDYRNYAKASIKRRIKDFMTQKGILRISEILPKVLHNETFFQSMISSISVSVTEMFRDPVVYKKIRNEIIPFLKTYPFIRIWHAGLATGEEVYSMAILLKEEGIYDRSQIYATDVDSLSIERSRSGIYPIENIKRYTANYQQSGAKSSFSEYYYSKYDSVIMNKSLRENIIFANHNLATDYIFAEIHFIICRNVLIYFDKTLQNKVLKLFYDSLIHNGVLCLGMAEEIEFSDYKNAFSIISKENKLYQKKINKY